MDNNVVETLEGNKLIAEFVNYWDFGDGTKKMPTSEEIQELRYHSSWDWLMPVCSKFDKLFDGKYQLLARAKKRAMVYEEHCDNIDHMVTLYEIKPVWGAIVNAIKWYNTQSK